ncbi:nitric oxide reductase activation protein NorD [Mycobacterium talmoniae]|uniref:MorD protein n=2 Tax=Mycobacterium talmoniae TaxID=1858794 RepID=A0A1S1NDZ0_9MYCO|nr:MULTISPECIES: VWA domain-containing protein [Mycobacterium]OHU99412.1 MorD protein [Mycobacterium talmoniae]TDH57462.1 VWA domain-containing protein [Mycobacterium eburneum]
MTTALAVERSCALTAVALSDRRRAGVRLISGERRCFGLNSARSLVQVPYPPPVADWTRRTVTCGVALQCSPSKDRIAGYPLHEYAPRRRAALALVEGGVALGWVAARWPGLLAETQRVLPGIEPLDPDLDGAEMLHRAAELTRSRQPLPSHPLLGQLPLAAAAHGALGTAIRRAYGRMPWTTPRKDAKRLMSVPVGGEGGVRNPNLPPPSRPENDDIEIRPDQRAGIPYPEWNAWTQRFLTDHVAVLERRHAARGRRLAAVSPELRRWFEEHTHRAMRTGLEDGSDLDLDRYVSHYVDTLTGTATQPRVFRDLLPSCRDVSTAVLLDGSSSLGIHGGRIFRLELACADALSRAMTLARERHGIFVFSGNTRHRVEVRCLKDFDDTHAVDPSGSGLATGGYTRLGAPLRHLTSRLLAQPSERRLLIVIGDGLMSDEGYEGRYAWADVAHAVQEAGEVGVTVYYLGVGPARVDPLPEVFGPRRSQRIRRVEELPRVLAHVHRELVAA